MNTNNSFIKDIKELLNISGLLFVLPGIILFIILLPLIVYYLIVQKEEANHFITNNLITLSQAYKTKNEYILKGTIKQLDSGFYVDKNKYLRYHTSFSEKNIHLDEKGISFNINKDKYTCEDIFSKINSISAKFYINGNEIKNLKDCTFEIKGRANINFI